MSMRTVKIVAGGNVYDTKITLAESGQEIQGVHRIDITIDARAAQGTNPLMAVIHIDSPEVEIVARAMLVKPWPPPEFVQRIFRAWKLWDDDHGIDPTPAELQHIHNMAEFAIMGLRRIN